jgi:urease accessory protein
VKVSRISPLRWLTLALLLGSAAAEAHIGDNAEILVYGSFLSGLTHPVLGFDHLLAMVSVGILSAQMGGRAIWTVPGTFVTVMGFGGLLGWLNIGLTTTEIGIAISVLVLGLAIAADRRMPIAVAMSCVGLFAIFHGYAHGAEMPRVAEPLRYATGFLTGTAALHVAGLIIGDISQHYQRGRIALRMAGGAIAGAGCLFLTGVI